jgi:hypothetical protein
MAERTEYGFTSIVRQRCSFLTAYGFVETKAEPTIVKYRQGELGFNIYHGRQSYEVGIEIGHDDEMFSMSELIGVVDPEVAKEYRSVAAMSQAALCGAVENAVELVQRYAEGALRDDPEFFAALRRQRESLRDELALDVLARQIRPKADAAFRAGRYGEAAELYQKIVERLSGIERAKLAAALKRC